MSNSDAPFDDVMASVDDLYPLYRPAPQGVIDKVTDVLDQGCRDFIARSPFVVVGTSSPDGRLDTSPRGGPPGFVKVLDDHRLAIPDLSGNNRLDTIRNVIEQGYLSTMFLIPGLGETLRVNGRAWITTDDAVLDVFTDELRRPKTAIGMAVDEAYVHCAKAFRRGGLWDPESWPGADQRPSPGQMLVDHSGAQGITGEQLDSILEEGYVQDLAADDPDSGVVAQADLV